MTNNLREAELFLSQAGSDCGIANVNIGTSGAEVAKILEEKKIPAAAESLEVMLGKFICEDKPILSTTTAYRLPKALSLIFKPKHLV